jgi:hypothetical protein
VGYLAIDGVLIVLVSLIPRYLERRNRAAGALPNRAILLPLVTVLGVGGHPGPKAPPPPRGSLRVICALARSWGPSRLSQGVRGDS